MKTKRPFHPTIPILIILLILALGTQIKFAMAQEVSYWQTAETIRNLAFEAQRKLFSATDENGTAKFEEAALLVNEAADLYAEQVQPALASLAPTADEMVMTALAEATTAAVNGEAAQLAAARGRLWTGLLWGSYDATLASLDNNDIEGALDWLRLREYRQSTAVNTVDDPAIQAIAALNSGQIKAEEAFRIVSDNLRDTYFFRLRQSVNELEEAADKQFVVRSSEWAGQAQGYFSLLQADFTAKQGDAAAAEVTALLAGLESASAAGEWVEISIHLASLQNSLQNYQPVLLSAADIQKRGQLLYLFIDLIYVEYKDGVRDGAIAIPIEYQEALTFHEQAGVLFTELRPTMEANNPDATHKLADHLDKMGTIMADLGDRALIQELVDESLSLVDVSLEFEALGNDSSANFIVIATQLDEVLLKAEQGEYKEAERTRLEAYAIFDAGPEARLQAFSPELAAHIDELFWQGDGAQIGLAQALAINAPLTDVQAARTALDGLLSQAQQTLGDGVSAPGAIIGNSAIIVFREGLEAVVIIAALLASMVGASAHFRRPLIIGALLALLATALTWVLAHRIMLAFSRYGERLEAVVSLIAIGVLLLITNWFFHKAYWTDWMARFHRQKKDLVGGVISGQALGLILLGFTAIYREGFETVLFLQALVLDAGLKTVLTGVGLGMLGVTAVGFIIFSLQTRLPYKDILIITGVLIISVLVTMVGNTVHVMQVVGWLPITPIRGVLVPYWMSLWLGIYATWQSVVAQFVASFLVVGSYYLAEYQQKRKRGSQFTKAKQKQNKRKNVEDSVVTASIEGDSA